MKTSESIKQLAQSLIGVQNEIQGMRPDANNPFFKSTYITLDGILEYVRPILTKNGIIVLQNVSSDGEYAEVNTRLLHISGEFMETDVLKIRPTKNDPQQHGSAITYAKRYQLGALLGISTEVDDDGNKATHGTTNQAVTSSSGKKLSTAQVNRFYAIASIAGIDQETARSTVMKKYRVEPKDMTKQQYDDVCKSIEQKIKG